jgi:uncharacterized iron-regulated membrane protein
MMRRLAIKPRQVWRRVHLWMGLSLGLILVIAGFSGSALVFYVEIDRMLHPEIQVERAAREPDWDTALATVRAAFPDKDGPWRFEVVDDGGAIPARYYNPPETEGRAFSPMMVWLSPDGGEVLRRDYWGDYAMTWLYNLHYQLLAGKAGAVVMGYAGLAALVLLASGLASWWPRAGGWMRALHVKPNAAPVRALYDWHKLFGLLSVLPLALLCATGAMLALPKETDAVLSATLGRPQSPPPLPRTNAINAEAARLADVVVAAQAALPGARLAWIETPAKAGGVVNLRLQAPGDPSRRFPHSYVQVDGKSGDVLHLFDARGKGPSNVLKDWLHPLHDGSFAGLFGRCAWLVVGMFPPLLFAIGVARWFCRHSRNKHPDFIRAGRKTFISRSRFSDDRKKREE